ncbi:class B sortase [uncultured Dysosmobacter sp.]|uniref:class B sortase n=1 Tax=uncultured Dysosmobacter sp. TaxID=2591384 RepID=UPI0026256A8E|nr:class B sortase [uncultured Dysosmobacter sp.]
MKRRGLICGGLLLVIGCTLFGAAAYLRINPHHIAESRVQAAVEERAETIQPQEEAQAPAEAAPAYVSPVDFEELWDMNPDIYAWLYIPGTDVNYPILQREGDDSFYLDHNSEGKSSQEGALFTEETYTKKDFSDPVTLVYGHNMRSGAMFGNLQETYSSQGGLEAYRDIVVYLPEQELHYEVFAAVPHDMRHILYYNDFTDPEVFQKFLEQALSVRSINANIDENAEVTAEDQLLILSTCLRGDRDQRYLVLAKRTAESAAP